MSGKFLLSLAPAVFLALSVCTASAQTPPPTPLTPKPALTPLQYVYSAEVNDYLYSTDPAEIQAAINIRGYDDLPAVGKVKTLGLVEKTPQTNTLPLLRFYAGSPLVDHFYTIDALPYANYHLPCNSSDTTEAGLVRCMGWQYEHVEAYFYRKDLDVPGTVPVYRLNKYNPVTGDQVHYFAIDTVDIQSKLQQGFSNDGIAGRIYRAVAGGAPRPTVLGGHIIGRRCAETAVTCTGERHRDYYFGQSWNQPSTTNGGNGAGIRQSVTFDYVSWNWSRQTGHQDVMLRNTVHDLVSTDALAGRYDGVGIIFGGFASGPGSQCYNELTQRFGSNATAHDRIVIELWRPDKAPNDNSPRNNGQVHVDCSTISTGQLVPGVTYSFTLDSYNNGDFCYAFRRKQDNAQVQPRTCYNLKSKYECMPYAGPQSTGGSCPNGANYRPFPQPEFGSGANSYYSVLHATDAQTDVTSYFLNFRSIWYRL